MYHNVGDILLATINGSFSGRRKMDMKCKVKVMESDRAYYKVKLLDTGKDAWPEEGYTYITTGKDGWFTFHGLTDEPKDEQSCL
jgi:hypothetical protein